MTVKKVSNLGLDIIEAFPICFLLSVVTRNVNDWMNVLWSFSTNSQTQAN